VVPSSNHQSHQSPLLTGAVTLVQQRRKGILARCQRRRKVVARQLRVGLESFNAPIQLALGKRGAIKNG
jgi:hypothetical protein